MVDIYSLKGCYYSHGQPGYIIQDKESRNMLKKNFKGILAVDESLVFKFKLHYYNSEKMKMGVSKGFGKITEDKNELVFFEHSTNTEEIIRYLKFSIIKELCTPHAGVYVGRVNHWPASFGSRRSIDGAIEQLSKFKGLDLGMYSKLALCAIKTIENKV